MAYKFACNYNRILGIPEFPKPCVIPRLDRGISSNRRHCEE
ncbi:MAG: hypothetical protein SPJ69_09225 [Campylobacter sp.]|nr:hypothetical protein [Campylobacter sp.]MDD7599289.1 hypothetical protein [Campylobacteraceae bacterium]MDY5888482.1 hypothetical protein [Campylobacter sp.]